MKLTLLLTVIAVINLSAATYSQEKRLNVNLSSATIGEVFKTIEEQSDFNIFYKDNQINTNMEVNLNMKNASICDILDKAFKNTHLSYTVLNKIIVITNKGMAKFQVSGTVFSGTDHTPIVGAIVAEKGTQNATVTDITGKFKIDVKSSNAVLIVSLMGFESNEVSVNGSTKLDISLKEKANQLNEVVVIGYGTQRKKDLSGSVVHTNLSTLQESPNVSLGSALQGTIPGLNVGAVTQAGSDPQITIRGRTSISGSLTPLIVLDGIIYRGSLVDINPNDIAAIDVLKDASAAAIYGSQASNGVILITSKAGKNNKKPTIEYSYSFALQEVANKDMLPENGAGYIRKIGDRFLSESRTGDDMLTPNPNWDPTSKFFGPEILAGYQNKVDNNWWNLLTNKTPYIQNHNVNISGKSELSSYFFSLGYTDQKNVIINDAYKRYSFRLNLDTKITNWMKIGVQSFMSVGNFSNVSPSISDIIGLPPQIPYLDSNGKYILQPYRGILNPFLQMDQKDLDKRNNLFGNIYADVDVPFIKGLNYRLNFSQNLIDGKRYNFNSYAQNFTGEGYKTNSSNYSLTLDNIISYRKTFGNHAVNGTFVYGIEKNKYESTTADSKNYANNVLGYNKLDAGQSSLQTTTSSAWEESSLYAMLRLGYVFKDRYILTGTVRRDGFSGFGPNNKFGTFPSAALAWRLSEESFIKDKVPVINDLKLRLSYGVNGNRTVGRYATLSKIESSITNGYLFGDGGLAELGQRISSLSNPNLKWESTKSLNLGLDFTLLKNRLMGSIDYYNSHTYDLLYDISIPVLNGFGTTSMNIGKLKNSGLEFSITGIPIKTNDFSWDITFNFSRNRNKVVSILGIDANGDGKEDDLVSSKIFINQPYGVAYDFNIIGMWQLKDYRAGEIPAGFTYGTYKVEDINKDGSYTAAADRKILGYTDPSYRFSILSKLKYKDWELKIFVNSIQGGKNYYLGQPGSSLANPDNIYGSNLFKFDYWTPENPNARYRQLGYYTVALGETFSPYIQRSFVRLQDLTLSYNLHSSIVEKLKIGGLKVFVTGTNLLTFTKWDGWDPETGTGLNAGAYPVMKSYTIGLNVEF